MNSLLPAIFAKLMVTRDDNALDATLELFQTDAALKGDVDRHALTLRTRSVTSFERLNVSKSLISIVVRPRS